MIVIYGELLHGMVMVVILYAWKDVVVLRFKRLLSGLKINQVEIREVHGIYFHMDGFEQTQKMLDARKVG